MKCFDCDWLDCVDNMFCQYCIENDYILYATKEDKELCDMMCGEVEEDYDEEEENMNMRFIVKDKNGKDITNFRQWYIDTDGCLYFETEDVDCPIMIADNEYTYEIIKD